MYITHIAGLIEASLSKCDPRSLFLRWQAFEGCPERVHQEINDILKHVEKESIVTGEIVALNVAQGNISNGWFWNEEWGKQDIFGDYVLVRVAKLEGMVVEVYVHPHEIMTLTAPRGLIHSLDWSKANPILYEGNNSNVMFFSNPLFCLEQMIQGEIKKVVENHLSSAGYHTESERLVVSKVSKKSIEKLMKNQDVLDDFSFLTYEELCEKIENNIYHLCMEWLKNLPLGLIVSQISDALTELENVLVKISQSVKRELNNYQDKIVHQLSAHQSLVKKIMNGSRKEEVFDQVLSYVEVESDKFLQSIGYFNTKGNPIRRQSRIEKIWKEKGKEVGDLVARITIYVYSNYLDVFLEELEILTDKKTGPFLCNPPTKTTSLFLDSKMLKRTLRYLKQMKNVDFKILKSVENGEFDVKQEFLSDVPIQALVIANLEIHEEYSSNDDFTS